MFAKAGGSPTHSLLACNLIGELRNRLQGRQCVVFNSDLRIKVEPTGLFTYPDASVVCGQMRMLPGADDVLVNPVFLAEVLSPSTEAYDRGKKSEHYRQIQSLRGYFFISQEEVHAESFSRDGNQWVLAEASGLEAAIEIPALEITLALSQIYAKVELVKNKQSAP